MAGTVTRCLCPDSSFLFLSASIFSDRATALCLTKAGSESLPATLSIMAVLCQTAWSSSIWSERRLTRPTVELPLKSASEFLSEFVPM